MWLHVPGLESSPSAPGSECSTSDSDSPCQALGRFATWRGKSRPPRSWQRVCETESFTTLLSGLTSPHSTLERGAAEWISSLEASPASPSPAPESVRAPTTSDGSGATSPGSSTSAGLKPFSLRMSLGLFAVDLSPSSEDLPRSGSMRSGICSERPISAHRTSGSGCSSSEFPTPDAGARTGFNTSPGPAGARPLLAEVAKQWPTPRAAAEIEENLDTWERRRARKAAEGIDLQRPLDIAVRQWPTASANDHKGSFQPGQRRGQLSEAAEQTWPTPITGDAHLNSTPEAAKRRLKEGKVTLSRVTDAWPSPRTSDTNGPGKHGTGGMDLRTKAAGWATPMASDGSKPSAGDRRSADLSHQAQGTTKPGASSRPKLNPLFVEWLMGLPLGWTAFAPVETGSFQRWLLLHGANSRNGS